MSSPPPLPLLLPATWPRPGLLASLLPVLAPLGLLRPPGLPLSAPEAALAAAGALVFHEVAPAPAGLDRRLAGLEGRLGEWGAWLAGQRGSGRREVLGLGLPAEATSESVAGLRAAIEGRPAAPAAPAEGLPPLEAAGVFLHLDHLREREAARASQLMAAAERGRDRLAAALGLEDVPVSGPPVAPEPSPAELLPRRLRAWALWARRAGIGSAWPLCGDREAAEAVLARHAAWRGRATAGPALSLALPVRVADGLDAVLAWWRSAHPPPSPAGEADLPARLEPWAAGAASGPPAVGLRLAAWRLTGLDWPGFLGLLADEPPAGPAPGALWLLAVLT